jgi:nucleoside-diphosphate-sugar epimerase
VSSIAALGDLTAQEAEITEESEWNPEVLHSDYAISKYGAEMEIWRGKQEGLNVVLVNPGVILGPGFCEQGSGVFFSIIKKGVPFYTQGISAYVGVWDVVNVMVLLMQSSITGERYTLISENV